MNTERHVPVEKGYIPSEGRGYQPSENPTPQPPTGDPNPQSGYVPTGTGDNPSNNPGPPPGDE